MSGSINSSIRRSINPCVAAVRPNFTPSHQSTTPILNPKMPCSPFTTSSSPVLTSTASPMAFGAKKTLVDGEISLGMAASSPLLASSRSMTAEDTSPLTKPRSGSISSRFASLGLSADGANPGSEFSESYIAPLTAFELNQVMNGGVAWMPPSSSTAKPMSTAEVIAAIEAKELEVAAVDAVEKVELSPVESVEEPLVEPIAVSQQVTAETVPELQQEVVVVPLEAVEAQTQTQTQVSMDTQKMSAEEAALWAAAAECDTQYFDDAYVRERQAKRFADDGRPRTADGKLIRPEGKVYLMNDTITHDSAHVYYKPSDVAQNYDDDRAPQCTVPRKTVDSPASNNSQAQE